MIENDGFLQDLIKSILTKVSIVKNDLDTNGHTHCNYALEKLLGAKNDLDIFVRMCEKKQEEIKKENKGE